MKCHQHGPHPPAGPALWSCPAGPTIWLVCRVGGSCSNVLKGKYTKMTQHKRYRKWCWTDFSMDVDFYEALKGPRWRYLLRGTEVCPSTGKAHWQCFGITTDPRTERAVRKELKPRHVEFCKGTEQQNEVYCSKDGEVDEWGVKPKSQGARTDLDIVRDTIDEGKGMREVVTTASSYQAIKVAEKYLEYKEPGRAWKPEVYWYYGETGSGKTRRAFEEAGDDTWVSGETGKWFQGYDGHENVIFDDFRADFCKFHVLLRILDRYAYRIEHKGGARQFLAKRIWITCPKHPREVYGTREDVHQLLRRIDKVECFKNNTKVENYTKVGGNTTQLRCDRTPTRIEDADFDLEKWISE